MLATINKTLSNQLTLVLKQGFKFLNTLVFSLKDKIMFLIGKGSQILGSVITLNSIQMMDSANLSRFGFLLSHIVSIPQWTAIVNKD